LMRIWILLFILMRIRIRILLCHFDAYPDPSFQFDAVPDPEPSFQIITQTLEKVLKWAHFSKILACDLYQNPAITLIYLLILMRIRIHNTGFVCRMFGWHNWPRNLGGTLTTKLTHTLPYLCMYRNTGCRLNITVTFSTSKSFLCSNEYLIP
jgi:hypothetical protein